MNTGGQASEKTLRDELAIGIASGLASYVGVQFSASQAWDVVERMLAEKARREATDKDSLTVPDHSPDATKMIALEAANRELVETLRWVSKTIATTDDHKSKVAMTVILREVDAIIAKHKGAK